MHPVAKHSVVAESSGWHARNVGAGPTRTAHVLADTTSATTVTLINSACWTEFVFFVGFNIVPV